jgi:hypothetical protein
MASPRIPLSKALHPLEEDAEEAEEAHVKDVDDKEREPQHIEIVNVDFDDDEHDGSTLVGGESGHVKEKEVDIEVTDNESDGDAGISRDVDDGGGIRRKRTIRVVIRSRAFL